MKKNKKAFTLVELVIVIAVIAILSAVLIPTFAGILTRAKESVKVQQIISARDELISGMDITSITKLNGYVFVNDDIVYVIEDGQAVDNTLLFDVALLETEDYELLTTMNNVRIYIPATRVAVPTNFEFILHESTHTATLTGYHGEIDADVVIPEYVDCILSTSYETENYSSFSDILDAIMYASPSNIYTIYTSTNGTDYVEYDTFSMADFGYEQYMQYSNDLSSFSHLQLKRPINIFGIGEENYLVTEIANGALTAYDSITSVEIPESVVKIGNFLSDTARNSVCTYDSSNKAYYLAGGPVETYNYDEIEYTYQNEYYYLYYKDYNSNSSFSINPQTNVICSCGGNSSNATSLNIPANVKYIDTYFFNSFNSLSTLTVSNDNEYYMGGDNCMIIEKASKKLIFVAKKTTYNVPVGVEILGEGLFNNYQTITINLPEGLKRIEGHMFHTSGLTSLVIPSTVEYIDETAFDFNLPNLTSISVTAGNTTYNSGNAGDNVIVETETKKLIFGGKNSTLPNDILIIGSYAFTNSCSETLVIPASVVTICDNAFYEARGLRYLSFASGSHLETIGNSAFCMDSNGPITISLPEGLESIGDSAFSNCTQLTTINIPSTVTHIGNDAFHNCTSISSFTLAMGNTSYELSGGNLLVGKAEKNILLMINRNAYSVEIPSYVTKIPYAMFKDCTNLNTVIIPSTVQEIGSEAFMGCENLRYMYDHNPEYYSATDTWEVVPNSLPTSLKVVSSSVFYGCNSLVSLIIPEGVEEIESKAFMYCYALTSVNIPSTCTKIDNTAYEMCYGLTSLSVTAGNTVFHSENNGIIETATHTLVLGCSTTTFSDQVTAIGENAFYGRHISSITIPDTVTAIGYYAFAYNYFTSIVLPNNLYEVKTGMFSECTSLGTVTFGSGTRRIDPSVFWYTKANMVVYFNGSDASLITINRINNNNSILSNTATWYYVDGNVQFDPNIMDIQSSPW